MSFSLTKLDSTTEKGYQRLLLISFFYTSPYLGVALLTDLLLPYRSAAKTWVSFYICLCEPVRIEMHQKWEKQLRDCDF